jgi:hypothetical protein
LRCQECQAVSDEDAWGWRAVWADDPDDAFEEPFLAFYCPWCAEREFGPSRRIDSGQTDAS